MADRSLSAVYARQNTLNEARETRILRDRLTAYEDALDRLAGAGTAGAARQLVQVYDGGSMPSSPGLFYFTHPVLASGAETEGGTATLTADTASMIPVVVLGGIPAVGDYLVAYAAGGRWVSEIKGCKITINVKCSGTNVDGDTVSVTTGGVTITGTTNSSGNVTLAVLLPISNPYTIDIMGGGNPAFSTSQDIACGGTYDFDLCSTSTTCEPCNIPNENLTISWTNLLTGSGSATLTYSGPGAWGVQCVDENLTFALFCEEGTGIVLRASFYISGECPTGGTEYCSNDSAIPLNLVMTAYECSPFSVTFTTGVGGANCPALYSLGNTQFVITL